MSLGSTGTVSSDITVPAASARSSVIVVARIHAVCSPTTNRSNFSFIIFLSMWVGLRRLRFDLLHQHPAFLFQVNAQADQEHAPDEEYQRGLAHGAEQRHVNRDDIQRNESYSQVQHIRRSFQDAGLYLHETGHE